MKLLLGRLRAFWHGMVTLHQIATYVNMDQSVAEIWCLDCHEYFYRKETK